jgi:hypothetical protein
MMMGSIVTGVRGEEAIVKRACAAEPEQRGEVSGEKQ